MRSKMPSRHYALRIGKFLLVLLYGVSLLLLAEVVLRGIYIWRYSSASEFQQANAFSARAMGSSDESLWEIPWEKYRPGSSLTLDLPSGSKHVVVINSKGFRTREFSEKPEGTVRIIAIGGSTTVQGASNDETYPALLEHELSVLFPDRRIEVLNLGVSGTRSYFWLSRLDELLSYQPDIVIQYNAINDITRPLLWEQHFNNSGVPWFYDSYLYHALFSLQANQFADVYDVPINNFYALRNALEANGVRYITATFAVPNPATAEKAFDRYLDQNTKFPWGRALGLYDFDQLHQLINAYNQHFLARLASDPMPVVRMDQAVSDARYFVDVCHMNQAGVALQAKAFLPVVAEVIRSLPAHEPLLTE